GTCQEYLPYGRVLTGENGDFIAVVEDRDCTPEQKEIRDLNVGIYAFDCKCLLEGLSRLENKNSQKEYYLTDVPAIIQSLGGKVKVFSAELNEQIIGVNTPDQLAETERYLLARQ
ncbi:MAG: UDP-N-acetylglucosamine diphosphorylase, partial [Eubacteriales bacterium]